MHVPPPGALGSHQAIVVAWGVNAWHLGIFFKVSGVCNLMARLQHEMLFWGHPRKKFQTGHLLRWVALGLHSHHPRGPTQLPHGFGGHPGSQ